MHRTEEQIDHVPCPQSQEETLKGARKNRRTLFKVITVVSQEHVSEEILIKSFMSHFSTFKKNVCQGAILDKLLM